MTLREIRQQARMTQAQAAEKPGVSLRSYKTYEKDPSKEDTFKYQYLTERRAVKPWWMKLMES